ncbi:MAG TPA: hypothetical protein VIJ57_02265, partial [Hanamia sp.]
LAKYFNSVLWQDIDAYEPFRLMGYDDYQKTIRLIREFIDKCFINKYDVKEKLKLFTNLTELQNFENPFTQRISSFIDVIDELLEKNCEFKRCEVCEKPFNYTGKPHCGDVCERSAENRRHYRKNWIEIRRKNNEAVREQRQTLKKYKVTKLSKKEHLEKAKRGRVVRKIEEKVAEGGTEKMRNSP